MVDLYQKSLQDDLTGQVDLKFQYSMTKTFTTVISHRLANPGLPVMMPWGFTVNGSFVWNFEFGSLGFALRLGSGW